jgi:hypothetical protein
MSGRHTDPDRGAFWRSLASAAAKALLVLVLLAGVTTLVVYFTVDRDGRGSSTVLADGTPTPEPTVTPDPARGARDPEPTTPAAPSPAPDEAGPADADESADAAEETGEDEDPADEPTAAEPAPPDEVPVQVIDSGGGAQAVAEVLGLLEAWGYDIVAVNPGLCCYEATTLFYSDGHVADAEALQARDERFAVLEENRRLAEDVAVHIVVGEDWDAP